MGGRSSSLSPGACTRRGPVNETGLARSDQMGSVRIFTPSAWMRNVLCPTGVTSSCPFATRAGGLGHGPLSAYMLLPGAAVAVGDPGEKSFKIVLGAAVLIIEARSVKMFRYRA